MHEVLVTNERLVCHSLSKTGDKPTVILFALYATFKHKSACTKHCNSKHMVLVNMKKRKTRLPADTNTDVREKKTKNSNLSCLSYYDKRRRKLKKVRS